MIFRIHEELDEEEKIVEKENFKVYNREFKSLEELMDAVNDDWFWAKVEISTTFGNEITLRIDDSEWGED